MIKRVAIIFVALVALFFVIGLFLPEDYSMQRSRQIAAPAPVVFKHVNTLTLNQAWSPWAEKDNTIKTTYSGTSTAGVGAVYSWTSENSGEGRLEITESVPNKKIVTALDFGQQGKATAAWTFEEKDGGTYATWSLSGKADNVIGRYFGLMMDSMVGPDYERGLERLEEVAKKEG